MKIVSKRMCVAARMQRNVVIVFSALLVAVCAQAAPVEHWTLPNGAQVYMESLKREEARSMVGVQIDFAAGRRYDPPSLPGLANMAVLMARKGVGARGAEGALDEAAVNKTWADLGAKFAVSADRERMRFTLLMKDPMQVGHATALAARAIGEPAFKADVWLGERKTIQGNLEKLKGDPIGVAEQIGGMRERGIDPGTRFSVQSIGRIQIEDVRRFYEDNVVPCRARVSIVGELTRELADKIAARMLSRLPGQDRKCAIPARESRHAAPSGPDRAVVAAAPESAIRIGLDSPPMDSPDYFALAMGVRILADEGFQRRFDELANKKIDKDPDFTGFAYSNLDERRLRFHMMGRPDQVDELIRIAREAFASFVAEGPTEAELEDAKARMAHEFQRQGVYADERLASLSEAVWNGLPPDWMDARNARADAVTAAQIKEAFARFYPPERLLVAIAGQDAKRDAGAKNASGK